MELDEKRWIAAIGGNRGRYVLAVCKWLLSSVAVGVACGAVGAGFHAAIDMVTEFRMGHTAIIWLLPVAGVITLLLYKACRVSLGAGTNLVIRSADEGGEVSPLLAPLIFAGTLLSHLFGASVGREGAALQLGGSIGHNAGRLLRLDGKDIQVLTMCGMAGCFSALFGTPLTAAVFVLEMLRVGNMRYNALLPCAMSSYTAAYTARQLGTQPMAFALDGVPALSPVSALQVLALAALCGLLGMLFCAVLHQAGHLAAKLLQNPYLRIAAGGLVVAVAAPLLGLHDYTGAGGHMIAAAISGSSPGPAFLIKMLFTALCVGVGFRGGEIVPTMFIGSAFGCVAGPLLGLDPGFSAAVGLTALFCSVVNCPIASVFLAAELFAPADLSLFALAVAAAYVFSGYSSLYSSQRILFSKVKQEDRHSGSS